MYFTTPRIILERNSRFLRRTRTLNEIFDEDEDEDENAVKEKSVNSNSDDEDDGPIYNPKNLPLGWDGKPIRT